MASLARPGGNITGLSVLTIELTQKRLALLKEAVPNLTRIALLGYDHPEVPGIVFSAAEMAARRLGLAPLPIKVADVAAFEDAFTKARRDRAGAIQVMPTPFFDIHRRRLIELAAKYRLPASYEFKNYVEDGGLLSYGPSINEMWRDAARYVDRILKGARPGDLPARAQLPRQPAAEKAAATRDHHFHPRTPPEATKVNAASSTFNAEACSIPLCD